MMTKRYIKQERWYIHIVNQIFKQTQPIKQAFQVRQILYNRERSYPYSTTNRYMASTDQRVTNVFKRRFICFCFPKHQAFPCPWEYRTTILFFRTKSKSVMIDASASLFGLYEVLKQLSKHQDFVLLHFFSTGFVIFRGNISGDITCPPCTNIKLSRLSRISSTKLSTSCVT